MTDQPYQSQHPYEDALDATTRALQWVDQQLAATRDANARLTAQLVAAEIREKLATEQLLNAHARIDDLEARLARWGG